MEEIERFRLIGLQLKEDDSKKVLASNSLEGLTIMITGNYSISREEMKKYIESHGGKVGSSVTSHTSYLVVGEKAGDAKIKKAEKLGIKMINEGQLYSMVDAGKSNKGLGEGKMEDLSGSGTENEKIEEEIDLFS